MRGRRQEGGALFAFKAGATLTGMAVREQPEVDLTELPLEVVPLDELRPHPKNYQRHPDDELEHIAQSIRDNGVYRNVVIARDGTLLAGHGVVQAIREKLGLDRVPVRRLDVDPFSVRALKVLAADNEISHLAERDDRLLTEILRAVKDEDLTGLLGTGYDEMMLANLVYVTRPEAEIETLVRAAHWAGMPEYDEEGSELKLVVHFRSFDDRARFAELIGVQLVDSARSTWWPPGRAKDDVQSVRFVEPPG